MLPDNFHLIKVGGDINLSLNTIEELPEMFGNIVVKGSLIL